MQNILDNYTLDNANNFLLEIDKLSHRTRIVEIYNYRIAQATDKSFRETMSRLRQQAKAAHKPPTERRLQMQTNEEKIWMAAREHVKFSELPDEQRSAFEAERQSMWSQIPAHLQDKAKKLAGH